MWTLLRKLIARSPGAMSESSRIEMLRVTLPLDRSRPGTLEAISLSGQTASGPWPAMTGTGPVAPEAHGVPLGRYKLIALCDADETLTATAGTGGTCALRLQAVSLATLQILIHGGTDFLSRTSAGIRVPDPALAEIIPLLPSRRLDGVAVDIAEGTDDDLWYRAREDTGSPARRSWFVASGYGRRTGGYENSTYDSNESRRGTDAYEGVSEQDLDVAAALQAAGYEVGGQAIAAASSAIDYEPTGGSYDR